METKHYQVLIKECPGGGVYFVDPEGGILAARSSIPEGAAYFLDNYAKAMSISPMELMLQMVARQPSQAAPAYHPVYPPQPMAPPPRPMEQAHQDNEPIPPGIIPDDATRLAERIKEQQRRVNGGGMLNIGVVPLLVCLALAHAWPFGA